MSDPDPFLPPPTYRPQRTTVWRTDVPGGGYAEAFGVPAPDPREAETSPPRTARPYETLVALTPRADVTRFLLSANVIVFGLMVWWTGGHVSFDGVQLERWGGNLGYATIAGQWWRLFTAMFLHVDLLHLGGNMLALWMAGPFVERLVGRTGYAIAYVLSGLAGSLAGAWLHPGVVSAGASGAIFGVFGTLLGFVVLRRDSFPPDALRGLIRYVLVFVGLSVALGLEMTRIDMAAHVGGFAGGVACGLALSQPIGPGVGRRRVRRNGIVAVVGSVLLVGTAWALPRPTAATVAGVVTDPGPGARIDLVLRQLALIDEHRVALLKATKSGETRAEILERDIIPAWRQVRARLAMITPANAAEQAEAPALARFMDLQEQSWLAQVEAVHEGDLSEGTGRYLAKLNRRAAQALAEFKQIREEGE